MDLIEQTLQKLGARGVAPSLEGFHAHCPFCESKSRAFRIAYRGAHGSVGEYFCHKCKAKGSLIGLYAKAYRVSLADASKRVGEVAPSLRAKKHTPDLRVIDPIEYVPYRQNLSEWLLNRGYEEGAIWHYRIGMDLTTNEIVIPIYSVDGRVVGVTRRIAENGKMSVNSDDYEKATHMLGIDLAVKSGRSRVYVVEGTTDMLGLMPHVHPDPVVSTLGANLSKTHAKTLGQHFTTIVLAYDPDKAGRYATRAAEATLRQAGVLDIRVVDLEKIGVDPGDLPKYLEDEDPDWVPTIISYTSWKMKYGTDSRKTTSTTSRKRKQTTGRKRRPQ